MFGRPLLSALLFLVAATALARPGAPAADDPIAAQLLKDKEAFAAAQDKARDDLLKGFDKVYETVKANKSMKIEAQLALLEKIEGEKKLFDESGTLPTLPSLKVALSEYRTALKKADTQAKLAFETAAKAYRDKGEVKAAGETLEEMKEFLAKAPGSAGGGAAVTGGATASVLACGVSNKVLGLKGGGTDDGTRVVTADYVKGEGTQLWKTVAAGNGWVYVENVKTGLVMTANGKNNGAEVFVSKKAVGAAAENQLWKVTPVPTVKGAIKLFAKPSGKLIGVDAKSKDAGARILLWSDQDTEPAQMFAFMSPPK